MTGIDPVLAYVAFAREGLPDRRVHFEVGTAETLPFLDRSFDAALALLVLQDFTDPAQAVKEMRRVTRPGGVVGTCQWDFRDGLPMLSLFWQAAEAVAPDAVSRHRNHNPSLQCATLHDLEDLWRSCGLSDIETTTLETAMHFSSFDDFWEPFLGRATPSSAFAATLNIKTDGALATALRKQLPCAQPDGSFVLPARAWAVKGTA
jgi:ubiquinone/menaquinone biosynthesis C-methylase UbiE